MAERNTLVIERGDQLMEAATRRTFLKLMAIGGTAVLLPSVFAACHSSSTTGVNGAVGLDLSNDTGILNYAYALEQLEAAFYTAALTSAGFSALSANEQEVLGDLQKHEVIHREFFKAALGSGAIGTISFNTTTVGSLTKDRATLLGSSQLLEDTGVSAYNGAGKYLSNPAYLLLAGKIVSVEARHAAAIRDIRDTAGTQFAGDDVINAQGLDVKAEPKTVIAAVGSLNVLTTPVSISTQPTRTAATPDMPAPTPT